MCVCSNQYRFHTNTKGRGTCVRFASKYNLRPCSCLAGLQNNFGDGK